MTVELSKTHCRFLLKPILIYTTKLWITLKSVGVLLLSPIQIWALLQAIATLSCALFFMPSVTFLAIITEYFECHILKVILMNF